jgi:hypothetical protein
VLLGCDALEGCRIGFTHSAEVDSKQGHTSSTSSSQMRSNAIGTVAERLMSSGPHVQFLLGLKQTHGTHGSGEVSESS